jgi:hypothetical protein
VLAESLSVLILSAWHGQRLNDGESAANRIRNRDRNAAIAAARERFI